MEGIPRTKALRREEPRNDTETREDRLEWAGI